MYFTDTKTAISLAGNKSTQDLRDELADKCVKILTAYRKHCAVSSSPGQLILPDSFKLLPLFTLGMLKSTALKSHLNLDIDTRVHQMKLSKSLGVLDEIVLLYPRLIPISHLTTEVSNVVTAFQAFFVLIGSHLNLKYLLGEFV
jgi:protein transport protein SEC24